MRTKDLCEIIFTNNSKNTTEHHADTPFFKEAEKQAEKLRSYTFERVSAVSHDGVTLKGRLRKSENAKRIIIAVHGYKSSWDKDFALIYEHLFDTDCTVLFVDQRCHGLSGGKYITFGITERRDCLAWIDYVKNNVSPLLPVYLYGVSMGAATVLMASGRGLPACVHGIIADSPFNEPADVVSNSLEKAGYGDVLSNVDRAVMKKYGFSMYDYSVKEALKANSRPILFFHGKKDNISPVAVTQKIFSECKTEKELVIFENSKHLQGVFDEKEKYLCALDAFFEKYDNKTFTDEIHLNYPEKTMFQLVKEAAEKLPDDTAYDFMGSKTSYKEMVERIETTARAFLSIGIKQGDRVTVCMPNTPQAIDCLYGLNRIGAAASFIHPMSAPKEIAHYLTISESKAIIVPDLFYENVTEAISGFKTKPQIIVARIQDELSPILNLAYTLKKGKDYLYFPDSRGGILWTDFIKKAANAPLPEITFDKNRTAVILYSGGTTGVSKGICLSDMNFNALAMQARISMECEFSRGLKNLSAMPVFHGFGLAIGIHTVLINNACCILLAQFNTKSYASTLIKKKPNFIAGVPTIFKMLTECKDLEDADLSFLKGMFVGGDSMPTELKKDVDTFLKEHGAQIQVREGYGLTECVTASCLTPKDTYKEGSIGLTFPDTYYKIVTPGTEEEKPIGEEGEIVISGPTVMLGYLGNKEETANVLRQHRDGRTWLHTGDLGFIDADGYVYFRQRIKRLIITSGYNVYPSQVEKAVESHEAVDYCCVIGIKDDYKMEKIRAYVVLKNGKEKSEELKKDIIAHCKKQIAGYAFPREIIFKDELPKTLVGKVHYRMLEEEARNEMKVSV